MALSAKHTQNPNPTGFKYCLYHTPCSFIIALNLPRTKEWIDSHKTSCIRTYTMSVYFRRVYVLYMSQLWDKITHTIQLSSICFNKVIVFLQRTYPFNWICMKNDFERRLHFLATYLKVYFYVNSLQLLFFQEFNQQQRCVLYISIFRIIIIRLSIHCKVCERIFTFSTTEGNLAAALTTARNPSKSSAKTCGIYPESFNLNKNKFFHFH